VRKVLLLAALCALGALIVAPAALAQDDAASPTATDSVSVTATDSVSVTATDSVTAAAAQYKKKTITALPGTGGPELYSSVLALGAGALLVGGGLVARRIIRQ
jgi:hypothetical protein